MRIHLCFLFLLVTAFSFAGCEEEPVGSSGSAGNQGKPCEREADCDDENSCTFEFCVDGACTVDTLNGVEDPEAEQVDGDCQMLGCAEGQAATLPDNDPPQDPNEGDCTLIQCADGMVTETLQMAGEPCFFNGMDGVCDAAGTCSCKPPTTDSNHVVDPVNGTDDPNHGGRGGACALKTISYALTLATADVIVLPGTYTSASGESPPYVLDGNQDLICADINGERPILRGGGNFMTATAVIALTGAANQVERCIVEGQGAAHGIVISSDSNAEHDIDDTNISGATNGIIILATANDVSIDGNQIHDNQIGVQWLGTAKNGDINDNTFTNNTTGIVCADPSPDITGGGNGGPTCQVCMNCPF